MAIYFSGLWECDKLYFIFSEAIFNVKINIYKQRKVSMFSDLRWNSMVFRSIHELFVFFTVFCASEKISHISFLHLCNFLHSGFKLISTQTVATFFRQLRRKYILINLFYQEFS